MKTQKITTTTLKQKYMNKNVILLDVRTQAEIYQHKINHPRFKHIDFYNKDFEQQLKKLDKNETYIIICNSGARSHTTQTIMSKAGYKTKDLIGGIQGWIQKEFPTSTSKK